jgi:glycosyltransferase involved in cell wall biosynthesis
MKKIKVVHIVPMLSPGGAERVAVHIVNGLNRERYEPVVISLMGRIEGDLDRLLQQARVEVRYLGKHLGFDYRMYGRLYRALKDCQPDIVHTHLHVLRYAFPCLLLVKSVACLHTVHNLAEREIEPGLRWLQRRAYKHGVVPIAVAEEVARSVERLYGVQQCRVIANGIPTDRFAHPKTLRSEWRVREGFRESDFLFVCVGRLAPQKNQALLLKAFARGPAADPRAHLALIGDGALRKQLEAQAEDLGVAYRTHFLGVRTDIPEVLSAMDAFVLSSDYEGNPLSVMEAMAAGLPIVSTAVGGVPDLFENGKEGILVQPGGARELSNCMMFLLQSPVARQSLGTAAARRAREIFDTSRMIRAYERLYESSLGALHTRQNGIPPEFIESLGVKPTDGNARKTATI